MSISHKELMALRRAHLAEKEKHSDASAPSPSGMVKKSAYPPPQHQQLQQGPMRPALASTATATAIATPGTSPARGHRGGPTTTHYGASKSASQMPKSIEPKVFSPQQTVVGHVPRHEILRRARSKYDASSVEGLLAERGIDYFRDGVGGTIDEAPSGRSLYHRLLPLEAFDNFEHNDLTPADYMEKGVDEATGEALGVPAIGVSIDNENRGRWLPCMVMQWNETEHKLLVDWDDEKKRTWLPRVHVCFRCEDPENFVERVVGATERRKEAEATLRFNLYVESMPMDEFQVIDDETAERIRDLSINTTQLLNNEDNLDVQGVMKQISTDYGRTMNQQLFEQACRSSSMAQVFQGTPLPKPRAAKPAPKFGQVQVPAHNMTNVMTAFHTNTYLNHQEEVILALHRIRDECDQVLMSNIFVVPPKIDTHRPLLLDDFDELQGTSITQRVMMLRDQWSVNVREHIKDSMASTNAGNEVNLNVNSKDEYEGTKMQRFMTTVKFVMQDAMYHLVTQSLESYVRFIEKCANYTVEINDLATVGLANGPLEVRPQLMGHDLRASDVPDVERPVAPLFKVSLKEEDKKVTFTTPPSDFTRVLIAIFDKAITTHQEVPQIESAVMEFIYNTTVPMIQSIGLHHPLSDEWRERLTMAITHAIQPLYAYLDTYAPFKDILDVDVATYIKDFEQAGHKIKAMDQEARRHLRRQQEVLAQIPQTVNLGTFLVDCTEFRKKLADKCQLLASKVQDLMAQDSRKRAEEIEDKFASIRSVLIRPVETPEDSVKIKEYMKTIPEEVFDLQQQITDMREVFDTLDGFQYALLDDDFTKKWRAVGWPARLDEDIVKTNQHVEQQRRALAEDMERRQEAFVKDVERLQKVVAGYYKRTDIKKVAEIASDVKGIIAEIDKARQQANTFNSHEQLFEREKTDYAAVHQLNKDFEPYQLLWITADDWIRWQGSWNNDPFESIDAEEMEKNVLQAGKNMTRVCREPKFKDKAPILKIAEDIKAQIDEFKPILPTVKHLRQQGMKERHWNQLSKDLGFEVRPGVTLLTLQDVYSLDLQLHEQTIMQISEVAAREYGIETSLIKMKKDWEDMRLKLKPYKDTGCYILPKDTVDDTQEMLDDHMLNTQALGFSPFKKIFEDEIEEWENNIKLVQNILDEFKTCQKSWMYLEPIFRSADIRRQLPAESERFTKVDENWKFLTVKGHEIDLTMQYCAKTDQCLDKFKESNELLERIQKGLNQYLENKRSAFARFYFISDDELLTILSESKDPQKIQPHFSKLFENIFRIDMREDSDNEMFGMYSQMKEYIPFKETVFPRKNVENWLSEVEHMMKRSIRQKMADGVEFMKTGSRKAFVLDAAGQVAIGVGQVYWTADCERYLHEEGSLEGYRHKSQDNLMLLVETVRQELTPLQRMNLGGLITIEVHARDIVQKLADEKIDNVFAFEWVSQLRNYWRDDDVYLHQVEAQLRYGYESLGNTTRLVITPLTDRIYLTLTGAMHMFLGSAPAGPAGTGKTETVKDLAKAVAKQCVVFNCQEGMTFQSMGKFFKGLANAGAWACFDEFNRIDVEVLSVVAQQVGTLQEAMRKKDYRIPFEGSEIVVDPTHSVFITMNPGYAGRTELPDNLKVLFRPVACMVPDYAMIAEIRLFSYGYSDSRKLAQKMVATFRLSSEQLSSQDHYDFGMRAVNTVISAAGLMKQRDPDESEDILLLRALRDSNAPKFLKEDLMLFGGIISDLFPRVQVPTPDYGQFLTVLEEKSLANFLQPTELFTKKCIEIFEMSVLRHGQMTVGPTMGGKTCASKVLSQAMTKLKNELNNDQFAEVFTYHLNPKSVTMAQLYGAFDDATGEWRDGLIAELFRAAVADTRPARKWIIFDGPVDALWIESMNTVLDDNKKLCLISSEIIAMSPWMNVMFEVEDLAVASPATVSRAGMIYMEPTTCLGVGSFIKSWVDYTLPKSIDAFKDDIEKQCLALFDPCIQFVYTNCTEYNPTVWPNLVTSCFKIFTAFLEPYTPTKTFDPPPEKMELFNEIYMQLLIFSVVWSFGATSDFPSRKKFDKFLREELRRAGCVAQIPDVGLLFDYEFVSEEKRWCLWTERAPPFTAKVTPANFAEIIVPTADVARYKWLFRHLLSKDQHCLGVGPTGTGKTLLVTELLMTSMPPESTPIFFTFSARTSANQTQDLIHSKFEVRRRASPQIWGAPIGKKFHILIDDVNMPMKETYGAQPPIEIIRQWLDYKGWYDRKTREFYNIVDTVYVGAMGPPGGGRSRVTNRFLRHFNVIAFPEIDDDNTRIIFGTILENFMKNANFIDEVQEKVSSLVDASIEVYNTICKELRPRPSRPHYLFNMRDLGKIFSGLLSADSKLCNTSNGILKMWLHEVSRVFRDRLVDNEDRTWFDELLKKCLQKFFRMKWGDIVNTERLMFVDFINPHSEIKLYDEVKELPKLTEVVERLLEEYNHNHNKKMNLVMFLDAIEHVCRISRIIRKPSGHALLLGVGGSGRQSASRLAAFINDFEVSQVEIVKGYSINMWKEDAKAVLRKAAFHNKQLVFLITDTQIVHEAMLEDFNNLLNSGEVPNLFVGPDIDEIMNAMKPVCQSEGIPLGKVQMYARFVKFCKTNMHGVMAMSPIGEPFRNRLRQFPALVNCCTIDWFSGWPEQALDSVAHQTFQNMEMGLKPEQLEGMIKMCVHIHQSVEAMSARFLKETKRINYVTPTSYLELLNTVQSLLGSENTKIMTIKNRMANGLDKLRETEIAVAELQSQLEHDKPLLIQRKEEIEEMVQQIAKETAGAEVTKTAAVADEAAAKEKTDQCTQFYQESEETLSKAKPALDEAVESLSQLKTSHFNEVYNYRTPPSGVILTMQGVLTMFNIKPLMKALNPQMPEKKEADYWTPAKELLSKPAQLLEKLLNYDKDNIPDRLIKAVESMIKSDDFQPAKIKTASQACGAMCSWCHAMYKYHFVYKEVLPLKEMLAVAKEELQQVTEKLEAARASLKQVEDRLAALNRNKVNAEEEMKELQTKVEITEIKLDRAGRLILGLAGEKKNWNDTVSQMDAKLKYLLGDMLCAAGQVSYSGPFTSDYRNDLLEQWVEALDKHGIPHSHHVSVFHTLQDPIETRKWTLHGLPADTLSIENAIFLHNARRWPLMIDPQLQANKWIRETYGEALEVLRPSAKDVVKRIEHAIRAGRPCLLENVTEYMDPSLDPLLQKLLFRQGGQEMIRISENPVPWSKDFKFFMTTKLPNPHYIPEIMVKVTLLNFFITPSGLEDQLLGVLVGQERKELEMQKNMLVQTNANMKAEVADIQKTILRKLAEVQGDILDDEDLIKYLDQSREKTKEIAEKVAEAEVTEKEIDATREGYRPVAFHSAILYFCCADLANVDPMYQYSLQWFVQLFVAGCESAERHEEVEERLKSLKDYFTFSFYQNISRSLFEKHKLMFSFVLCIRILMGANQVDGDEYRYLLSGPLMEIAGPKNPDPDWITDIIWQEVVYIDRQLPKFKGLADHFAKNSEHYHRLFMSADAHRGELAGEWKTKLTPLELLIFVRVLRPDKLMPAVQDFVSGCIGESFIKPVPFDLATSYKDSNPMTPLIFILSPGADPFDEWKKFAETQNMGKKLSDISLGQGQGPRAERLMKEGMENGTWVLLQNCHLATSWMPMLERLTESMSQGIAPTFRLWLTSMPNPHFPVSILQNGVKMTNEPPKGMRANISRSLASFTDANLDRCKKPAEFKKLTFSLCFFHALIQERRKFGPLGWNIAYEFTSGDLNCCIQQLQMFLDKYDAVPYKVIKELSGQIHYGGRVTDDWDRRTLITILDGFIGPEVMSDDFSFSQSGNYKSIAPTDIRSYLGYVESWPLNVLPEAFGLHENAEITCARNETFETLECIVTLQGASQKGGGSGKTPDDVVTELAHLILSKVRPEFDLAALAAKYPTKYEDSMNTVLQQEAIRFNRLITVLRGSLQNIVLAIKGLVVMSKDLESLYNSMFNNMIPDMWAEKAYPSLKPLASWVTDLGKRLHMIEHWYEKGHPKAYWISGFYFPQAFLTGILQNYARIQQISIDTISYGFEWINKNGDEVTQGPPSGCYIYGMFIEGARIDHTSLTIQESNPKVLFEPTPLLWLIPTINREKEIPGVYRCPLYKTLRRAGTLSTTGHSTNYVLTAELPSEEPGHHWVKRGVAMVCSLNY